MKFKLYNPVATKTLFKAKNPEAVFKETRIFKTFVEKRYLP